jgi:glycosyltransferase involved in cell wall biosynthesis
VASVNRNVGGPAISVSRLATVLAKEGVDSILATLDYPLQGPQALVENVHMVSEPAGLLTQCLRGWSPALQRRLMTIVHDGVSVVHNHGLWMFPNFYARQAALTAEVPLVISPRGMLEEWSLGHSRFRKAMAWYLCERDNLKSAALFHATSEAEAGSIRALGLHQPIAVISNGIDVPDISVVPDRKVLETRFPGLAGKRWLLFLSRLHPKKGITELLHVWGNLASRFPEWQLIIAGPDLDGYAVTLKREAVALELGNRITFTGMLVGNDKTCALANSDLFVLPTYSENFGIVIAEALAHRIPVVTTRAAPWSDLLTHNCGWWIDTGESALAATLLDAMQLPVDERRAMGMRGRDLMMQRYTWNQIATKMRSAYEWVLKGGKPPDCIRTL